jgi:hypothetical protein
VAPRARSVAVAVAAACLFAGGAHSSDGQTESAGSRFLVYSTAGAVPAKTAPPRPTVSPDRAWVWRARPDGSHRVRLVHGVAPAISPDGRWIVYLRETSTGEQKELDAIRSVGGRVRVLQRLASGSTVLGSSDGALDLRWFPDSRRLLAPESGGLFELSIDGGAPLALRPSSTNDIAYGPTISPDGKWLAYPVTRADGQGAFLHEVEVVSAAGGAPRLLLGDYSSNPIWGRPGIAYLAAAPGIRLLPADGAEARRLTSARVVPVAWSGAGRQLLTWSFSPGPAVGRLFAVDAPSGRSRAITGPRTGLRPLDLSSDGVEILATTADTRFRRDCGSSNIESIPFSGGKTRILLHGICSASWNA